MTRSSHFGRYVSVWISLLILTALSYAFAQLHLGAADVAIALVIAVVKVTLVALFFMHLRGAHRVLGVVALVTLLWVILLCLGIASDVVYR